MILREGKQVTISKWYSSKIKIINPIIFRKQNELQLIPHIVKENCLCHYVQKGVAPATLFWPSQNYFLTKARDVKLKTYTAAFVKVKFISVTYILS